MTAEQERIVVEPGDREAEQDYGLAIACGAMTFLEALARHRIAERESIVAWLRQQSLVRLGEKCLADAMLHNLAEAISRGHHLTAAEGDG